MGDCKIDTQVIIPTIILKQKLKLISIGIDVAMESLMVCELFSDGQKKIKEIKNSDISIKRFAKRLCTANYGGKIIMESTGRHHMLATVVMSEKNLDVRVINPLIAKKYSTAAIRKVKTDKRDSEILAEIGIKEDNLPKSFTLDRKALTLRKKMRLIASISKQLQNLTTMTREHKKTLDGLKCKMSEMENQIFETIATLKKQKEQLELELEKEICEEGKNNQRAERYDSIPGVTSYVGALAALLFSEEYSQSAKQWIAFAGLDVSVKESGNWRGKGHLTKRGNTYLRQRMFTAAWGATRHNEKFKEYYEYLRIKKNRKHREALVIIARKIIGIMFNLHKNNSFYDAQKALFVPA